MEPANIWIWAAKTSKKMQVWWKYTSHVACDVYINLVLHILRIWCNKCTIKTPEKNSEVLGNPHPKLKIKIMETISDI